MSVSRGGDRQPATYAFQHPEHAAIAQASFREDLQRGDFMHFGLVLQERLNAICEDVSLRHPARNGFRASDAIRVASAFLLQCDTFWSFDAKACKLPALEGLKVPRR